MASMRTVRRRNSVWLVRRSFWAAVPLAPPDSILGLNIAFKNDSDPSKVNLGVGAYRSEEGKPYVLDSVRVAEKLILGQQLDHEYADIAGNQDFLGKGTLFAYGKDSEPLLSGRVAAVQTLSGTGACRIAGEFLERFAGSKDIYLPDPTWGNHVPVMRTSGLNPLRYRYYNPETKDFDFRGFLDDVTRAPPRSTFLLHSCAHNPTGFDPSHAQWDELSVAMKVKEHLVLFDNAYQGFASGDAELDAYAIRKFVKDGHRVILAQSFAKVCYEFVVF